MITNEQATKIKAIYDGASTRLCNLLSHFPIVGSKDFDNPTFDVSVFLVALASLAFPEQADEIMEIEKGPLILYCDAALPIKHRLTLYDAAASGEIMPCGFWSMTPIDSFLSDPVTRVFALFGDFLVAPKCSAGYCDYPWPMLKPGEMAVFSRVFTTRGIEEIFNYISAIKTVIEEGE